MLIQTQWNGRFKILLCEAERRNHLNSIQHTRVKGTSSILTFFVALRTICLVGESQINFCWTSKAISH